VAHEGDGAPRMPLGGTKIPDALIAIVHVTLAAHR